MSLIQIFPLILSKHVKKKRKKSKSPKKRMWEKRRMDGMVLGFLEGLIKLNLIFYMSIQRERREFEIVISTSLGIVPFKHKGLINLNNNFCSLFGVVNL
jgi:hypothetical protein